MNIAIEITMFSVNYVRVYISVKNICYIHNICKESWKYGNISRCCDNFELSWFSRDTIYFHCNLGKYHVYVRMRSDCQRRFGATRKKFGS